MSFEDLKICTKDLTPQEQQGAREPMFSPVFLSPGGSFHKPQKGNLALSPDGKLAEKLEYTDKNDLPEKTEGVSWGIRKGDYNLLGLFGGAITIELPSEFEDVSSVRPIPDHQGKLGNLEILFIYTLLTRDFVLRLHSCRTNLTI